MFPFVAVALSLCAVGTGCGQDCCSFDGEPVALKATSDGALWARVVDRGSKATGWALLDTSSPVNFWRRQGPDDSRGAQEHAFDVLGAETINGKSPLRAAFSGVWAQTVALADPTGELDAPVLAVLGGEFWHDYAPIFDHTAQAGPTVTFWARQPASTSFLDTAKYAVLEMNLLGGGQLNAPGEPDFFGIRGPHQFPASQLIVRGCAAPSAFVAANEILPQCCKGDERALATGVDVSMALSTGFGGVLLSESAWTRINPDMKTVASTANTVSIFHPAHAEPIFGRPEILTGLALVNLEAAGAQDPGPCVELGRARRTEVVAASEAANSATAHCAEPCDRDPRDFGKGVASTAYVELTRGIEVLVIPDNSGILQSIRAQIRPEGPEIDGLLGASALKSLRIELDYRPRPARLIVSCHADASEKCRAVGRCPRLPDKDSTRVCFDLSAHRLPEICDNPRPACQ